MNLADEKHPADPLDAADESAAEPIDEIAAEPTDATLQQEDAQQEGEEEIVAVTEEEQPQRRRFSLADVSIYTVLLAIAFIFLLFGSLVLLVEWGRYGFDVSP